MVDTAAMKVNAKKWTLRLLFAIVALFVLIIGGWFATARYVAYSSGERVGFVQKLSTKGWICKTNEGELTMVAIPGQPAETFAFTVRDQSVVGQIDALAGHKVALKYEEHPNAPTSCMGETKYFVSGVRKAE